MLMFWTKDMNIVHVLQTAKNTTQCESGLAEAADSLIQLCICSRFGRKKSRKELENRTMRTADKQRTKYQQFPSPAYYF